MHKTHIKKLANIETGTRIKYGAHEYRLHSPAGPRKGWNVVRCGDGTMLRMTVQMLAKSEIM